MKLMNEIESEFDGEVVEICAKNEEMVEYGKPLFKIKRNVIKMLNKEEIKRNNTTKRTIFNDR